MFGCNTVFFLEGRRKVARFSIPYNRSDLPHIPVSVQQQLRRLCQPLLNNILMDRHTVEGRKSPCQLGQTQMYLLRQFFTRGGKGELLSMIRFASMMQSAPSGTWKYFCPSECPIPKLLPDRWTAAPTVCRPNRDSPAPRGIEKICLFPTVFAP